MPNYPSTGGGGLTQGTAAARPASPTPGQLYYATDTGELSFGNAAGNAWQTLQRTSSSSWLIAGAASSLQWDSGVRINANGQLLQVLNDTGFAVSNLTSGLRVAEGTNGKQGVATLVAGTVTVACTSVTANSRIFLTPQSVSGTQGILAVTARVAGTSFTVTSSNAADTSTFAYEIFEPG